MKKTDRYGRTLKRLLHELTWAISKRNAFNEFCRVSPTTSWGFFTYASVSLKNDIYSHAIKVLDTHRQASSFWYIKRCDPKITNSVLKDVKLSISEIQNISNKLKIVRDKTHFHIDKKEVFSPKAVWKKADINGKDFNKVIEGLWNFFQELHVKHFNESFPEFIYDAKDIDKIIKAVKQNGVEI